MKQEYKSEIKTKFYSVYLEYPTKTKIKWEIL